MTTMQQEDKTEVAQAMATPALAAAQHEARPSRRGVLLHDGLVLLVLCLVTVALFGVTLFLFKSFEEHRADLGRRWSARGRLALLQGKPEQAAGALRTALSYSPDNYADQLMLAQALAGAGHLEAASNYFLSLWAVHPGDGFLNLQLARVARQRGNSADAVNYYRASIFGNWEQHGVEQRREVRMELADYLAQRGEVPAAQAELLIAAGNVPERDEALQLLIANRLRSLGDLPDALHFYSAVATADPHSQEALANAGSVRFEQGDYTRAAHDLAAAAELARHAHGATDENAAHQLAQMAEDARRLPQLSFTSELPLPQRASHLMLDAGIAQRRLQACTADLLPRPTAAAMGAKGKAAAAHTERQPAVSAPAVSADKVQVLLALRGRWMAETRSVNLRALQRDAALDDAVSQLVNDTESQLAPICGAPTGDDALLLRLAQPPTGSRP